MKPRLQVMKFGGTSVGDAACIASGFGDERRDQPVDRGRQEGAGRERSRSRGGSRRAATAARSRVAHSYSARGKTRAPPATNGRSARRGTAALRRDGVAARTHAAHSGRDFEPGGKALRTAGGGGSPGTHFTAARNRKWNLRERNRKRDCGRYWRKESRRS